MAIFTRTNGDAQPVFALDTQNGPIAPSTSTAGSPVQPQGPKLEFFRFVAANTMAAQQGVNGFVANALQAIQQTTTIAMYQVDGVALSVAVSQLAHLLTLLLHWLLPTLLVLLVPTNSAHAQT